MLNVLQNHTVVLSTIKILAPIP